MWLSKLIKLQKVSWIRQIPLKVKSERRRPLKAKVLSQSQSQSTVRFTDVRPIGVSKRSCLCCVLWIQSHNNIFRTRWITSGSNVKPYANWALLSACSYAVQAYARSSFDESVLNTVSKWLTNALDQRFPGQKRIYNRDEGFNGELDWCQGVIDVARGRRSTHILGSNSGT